MTVALTNHIWQSTLFAMAAGLLALLYRRDRAEVRYRIWLVASLKFLVPFSLLFDLGGQLRWASPVVSVTQGFSFTVGQIVQPFGQQLAVAATPQSRWDWAFALVLVWVCGVFALSAMRLAAWMRIRAAVRCSLPLVLPDSAAGAMELRASPGLLEPGVVGLVRPVLLLPSGIVECLTPPQLDTVLAHELCHIRRRDNVFSAMHMVVEILFWFHPLVWWIGAQLVEERERACDEAVLRSGSEPLVYADAILNVCRMYVESPLRCVAGVTGASLKKRVRMILTERVPGELSFARKAALAVAGMVAMCAPIVAGVARVPFIPAPVMPRFENPVVVVETPRAAQSIAPVRRVVPQMIAQALPAAVAVADLPVIAQVVTGEEHDRRVAYALASFGSQPNPMSRIYVRYGPPDEIFAHDAGGAEDPSSYRLWRYNYLADFRSNAEFRFDNGRTMRINAPQPEGTFLGSSYVAEDLAKNLRPVRSEPGGIAPVNIAGLPGRRSSMQVYAPKEYRILSVPLDSLSGSVEILARITTRPSPGTPARTVTVLEQQLTSAEGVWQTNFGFPAGAYQCHLLVREAATNRTFSEMIDFDAR